MQDSSVVESSEGFIKSMGLPFDTWNMTMGRRGNTFDLSQKIQAD